MDQEHSGQAATPVERFSELAQRVVNVPKKDVDRKAAAYRRKRAAKKRRKRA